jgi:hypothetical protein
MAHCLRDMAGRWDPGMAASFLVCSAHRDRHMGAELGSAPERSFQDHDLNGPFMRAASA